MIRKLTDTPADEPKFSIEIVTDPEEIARSRSRFAMFRRNSDWLQAHWSDLLPQARGKFVAVAGQQAFVADTGAAARALAKAAFPDDEGAFSQYIPLTTGPRIYGNRRRMVAM